MKTSTLSMLAASLFLTVSAFAQTTILSENFEGGSLPAGWTQQTNATDGGWVFGNVGAISSANWPVSATNTTGITGSNDDACNCDKATDILMTPALDLSSYSTVVMSVDIFFQEGTYNGATETSTINVSTNGGTTWTTVLTLTGENEWRSEGVDLTAYAGMSSVTIGFNYGDDGDWLFGTAMDNVNIYEPLDYDIGISDITMADWALLSPQTITGMISNYGAQTITSADVSWSVDGGATSTQTFTGLNIAPLSSGTFSHSDTWTPSSPGLKNLVINTSNPNGQADLNTANDQMDMDILAVDQVVTRLPLYENFTSSTCGPCVPANATMLGLIGKDPSSGSNAGKWSLVKYQMSWPGNGDPYYTDEGGTRRSYYGVNSVPNLWIDGGWGQNGNNLTQTVIDEFAAPPSFLDISSTYTISGQTVAMDVTITPVADAVSLQSSNLVLHMAIVENETYQNIETNGETDFQFVMKKMVPNASGLAVGPFSVGTPVSISDSYTFNGSYILPPDAGSPVNHASAHTVEEFSDLSVVVWVQDVNTQEIMQSAWSVYTCGDASATSVNATCGVSDGSATATTTGGGTTYLWDDASAQTTATAQGLAAGVYNVTITDDIGCEVTTSVAVNNNGGASATVQAIPNSCSDGATGVVNLIISGGSNPYTYNWSNGASTESITGLVTGDYTVSITDAAGCMTFETATITAPDAIAASSSITASTGSDGAIYLSVTGGTPNYNYSWDNGATTQDISGLAPGTYTVTITDGFGCSVSESYTVSTSTGLADIEGLTEVSVYPNPFSSATSVEFTLEDKANVTVDMISLIGELVYTEDHGTLGGGSHKVQVSGESLAPGIYFVKLQIGERSITRKVIHN